jgi:hypothetical protein
MAVKLTPKQQTQLAWLEGLKPKIDRLASVVEQLAAQKADDVLLRSTQRLLGELKSQASGLGITALSENFGYMEMLLRRGGGHQMKVRGLREILVGAKTNYEGALRSATTPPPEDADVGGATSP